MTDATLRLFNGIIIEDSPLKAIYDFDLICKDTMKKGFILDPAICASNTNLPLLYPLIEKHIITFKDWNNSFYKSWSKLETLSDFELYMDQMLHYFTTYNFNEIGFDINAMMFIPDGDIEVPDNVEFKFIKALTEDYVLEQLNKMMSSGVALKSETQDDIISILTGIDYNKALPVILKCRNKELNTKFSIEYGIVPKNPTEFLRYIIQLSTGNSLVIKNSETISAIKVANNEEGVLDAFINYRKTHGSLDKLSESFYRYKPLWLAFKSYGLLVKEINRMRKLAKKLHKPMPKDLLNDITGMLNRNERITKAELKVALEKANSFRKIRLLYALNNMENRDSEVVYKIRNGKSYATIRDLSKFDEYHLAGVKSFVNESIVEDLREKVEGIVIKLSEEVNYALPATEKQFFGNFPSGSSVEIDGDAIVGVHWENIDDEQTDLDLSLLDMSGIKIGWNGSYRTAGVIYSGDVTNAPAPKGASEFFYFRGIVDGTYLLQLNFYNSWFIDNMEVPFTMIVGRSEKKSIPKNYMIDPNEVILQAPSSIDKDQKVLGIVHIEKGKAKFYFSESKVGLSNVSGENKTSDIQRAFMINQLKNVIDFEDMLLEAGAIITNNSEHNCDIDLSADKIDKDSILKLFY